MESSYHTACAIGDCNAVRDILRKGTESNELDLNYREVISSVPTFTGYELDFVHCVCLIKDDWTALMVAAINGHFVVVDVLLEFGVWVDFQSAVSTTVRRDGR